MSAAVVLPIFPLPDVTCFPHTFVPLHIFEARYRSMVTDALARDRRLCLARLRPGFEAHYEGKPAVFEVAGAGEIVNWERLPTGRYNILLKGLWRVRIERELATDTLYRVVRATPLEDAAPTADVSALVRRVRAACGRLLEALERPRDVLESTLAARESPGVIADRAAGGFLPDPAVRQEILEMLDVERRLVRVGEALEDLVKQIGGR